MSRTVWEVDVPVGEGFAELLTLVELMERQERVLCKVCGASASRTLIVEWDEGSDVVGDFTHAQGVVVTTRAIARDLAARFRGVAARTVKLFDHPNLRRPAKITKRTSKRVWLPYEGPALAWLDLDEVPLHPKSTVDVESTCERCGRNMYAAVHGIEEWRGHRRIRRKPGKGFFFARRDVGGRDFIKPSGMGSPLCTDRARRDIENRGLGNVRFLEAGEILG